jgi:putative ABC transport system substrate-binding protein
MHCIERRDFITLLGGATWPIAARAQQPAMPVIGLLSSAPFDTFASRMVAFRQGLKESGFVEGQNVLVEYRSSDGQQRDRLSALVADLIQRDVAVLVGIGSGDPARAAKATSSSIPIVFCMGGDPVGTGVVPSLSRPGANITGVTWLASELLPKRMELLRDLLPNATKVAFLHNPTNFSSETDAREMEAAARALGLQLVLMKAAKEEDIGPVFAAIAAQRVGAIVVQADSLWSSRRDQVIALAVRHELPAIYPDGEFVSRGGLMSYSADIKDAFRQAGLYTGRILKGEKPADLPVLQPTKFELVINLKTAKALGLTFPPSFHLRADEVIE